MNAIAGRILRYFFSGTLFIVPLLATAYFIYISFTWLDERLSLPYPGLGFLIVFSVITLIGYLSTNTKADGSWRKIEIKVVRKDNRDYRTSFLVVTHDPRIAARCERVIEIVDGRITRDDATPPPG